MMEQAGLEKVEYFNLALGVVEAPPRVQILKRRLEETMKKIAHHDLRRPLGSPSPSATPTPSACGGGSKGMQRDSVTQRQATPAPAAPAQQAAPQAAPQQPAAAGAAAQPKRNWLGPWLGLPPVSAWRRCFRTLAWVKAH